MAILNFPDPLVTNPWFDGTQWWNYDGEGWLRGLGITNDAIITGYKNRIINGNRQINQRGFDGDWAPYGNWLYGYDRWRKTPRYVDSVIQQIEINNIDIGVPYTLSWEGGNGQDGRLQNWDESIAVEGTSPITGTFTATGDNTFIYALLPDSAYNIQLEKGTSATDFEFRDTGIEALLCTRFYLRINSWFTFANQVGTNATSRSLLYNFPSIMRTTPTVTFVNDSGGVNQSVYPTTVSVNLRITGVGSVNNVTVGDLVADAEF